MTSGLFISGTDTGVGKTWLTAALLCAARAGGRHAAPMKPVQTGCRARDDRSLDAPDLEFCLNEADWNPDDATRRRMCPFRFEPACSPHLAARLAGTRIELAPVLDAYRKLREAFDLLLVEGAGGLMVPLNDTERMIDLAAAMELPVLLAARPGLGTINHTLLSLEALRRRGLQPAGVVFVRTQAGEWTEIERDNVDTVARYGGVKPPCALPYIDEQWPITRRRALLTAAGQRIWEALQP